jgi:hypothetical protein
MRRLGSRNLRHSIREAKPRPKQRFLGIELLEARCESAKYRGYSSTAGLEKQGAVSDTWGHESNRCKRLPRLLFYRLSHRPGFEVSRLISEAFGIQTNRTSRPPDLEVFSWNSQIDRPKNLPQTTTHRKPIA